MADDDGKAKATAMDLTEFVKVVAPEAMLGPVGQAVLRAAASGRSLMASLGVRRIAANVRYEPWDPEEIARQRSRIGRVAFRSEYEGTFAAEPRPAMTMADLRRAEETLRANTVPRFQSGNYTHVLRPPEAAAFGRAFGVDWATGPDRTGGGRMVANPGVGELSFQVQASRDGANWVPLPASATVEMLEPASARGDRIDALAYNYAIATGYDENWARIQLHNALINGVPDPTATQIGVASGSLSDAAREAVLDWNWLAKIGVVTADEALAQNRKRWREEAHKRTCEACLRAELTSPAGVSAAEAGWVCDKCWGTGYTIATPITRAQLEARLAWWERDRLAECDDEPSKAWYAGNAALVAELMKWCSPGGRAPRRAAVRAIPDGPWGAT